LKRLIASPEIIHAITPATKTATALSAGHKEFQLIFCFCFYRKKKRDSVQMNAKKSNTNIISCDAM